MKIRSLLSLIALSIFSIGSGVIFTSCHSSVLKTLGFNGPYIVINEEHGLEIPLALYDQLFGNQGTQCWQNGGCAFQPGPATIDCLKYPFAAGCPKARIGNVYTLKIYRNNILKKYSVTLGSGSHKTGGLTYVDSKTQLQRGRWIPDTLNNSSETTTFTNTVPFPNIQQNQNWVFSWARVSSPCEMNLTICYKIDNNIWKKCKSTLGDPTCIVDTNSNLKWDIKNQTRTISFQCNTDHLCG